MIYWNTKKQDGSFRRLPFTKIATIAWNNNWRVYLSADLSMLYLSCIYQDDRDFCLYGHGATYNDNGDNQIIWASYGGTKRDVLSAFAYTLRKRFERVTNGEKL